MAMVTRAVGEALPHAGWEGHMEGVDLRDHPEGADPCVGRKLAPTPEHMAMTA
jgi:hypothetical protein